MTPITTLKNGSDLECEQQKTNIPCQIITSLHPESEILKSETSTQISETEEILTMDTFFGRARHDLIDRFNPS